MRWDTFEQLAMRTSGFIYLDYNPSARFWAHDKLQHRPDATFEVFTYLDNEEIPAAIKADILSHDRNSNWWRVYGKGEIGELEGNVFSKWQFLPTLGLQCELIGYGLDFGFRPDPCAMVALHRTDEALVLQQVFKEAGLMSGQIIDRVRKYATPDALVVCDNARPEIIAEMRQAGLMAAPCIKDERIGNQRIGKLGQIERMAEQNFIAVGADLEREYLTYAYEQTKTGEFMPAIKDGNDHLLDAARYIWYWHHRKGMLEASVSAALEEY
jgi:phage terminase large subunit